VSKKRRRTCDLGRVVDVVVVLVVLVVLLIVLVLDSLAFCATRTPVRREDGVAEAGRCFLGRTFIELFFHVLQAVEHLEPVGLEQLQALLACFLTARIEVHIDDVHLGAWHVLCDC
jgi:hypothetical protein